MAELVIDLQEGFSNDSVLITVNGKEVYRQENVTTDYSVGLAGSIETNTTEDAVWLEVTIPSKHISNKTHINISSTPFVSAALAENGIVFKYSTERFVYF